MKITDLRTQIMNSLSECILAKNFKLSPPTTFHRVKQDLIEILNINFLNKQNAAYFSTNTASFSINLGICFNFNEQSDSLPEEYQSQVRGCLTRNFYQKHPMDLKGFSPFHPERTRKDLWWVNKDGSNVKSLTANAVKRINKKAESWFEKFSNIEYIVNYLKTKPEKDPSRGGPFGFGRLNSPARLNLIRELEQRCR